MIPGSADGAAQGHKTLAAIVFTDVAGFAHHANTDEQRALANLRRDMEVMKDVCARTSGTVLKTMGDGMLMRFPSANQALVCALEIQRIFHEQTKRLLPSDILWHRIGVHLGDVVVTADDVYGDGVNVAARLQKEAKPGSIFLSRTVYDVVKGKMQFPATYVGPRHLKGIAEPVAVWEVPSLGRLELEKRQEALMAMTMPASEPASGLRGGRAAVLLIASFVLVGGAITMVALSANRAAHQKLAASQHPLTLGRQPVPKKSDPPVDGKGATGPSTQDPAPTYTEPLDDPALFQALKSAFSHYDFASMSGAVEASKYATTDAGKNLIDRYGALNSYMGWFNTMLDTTTADNHITITSDPNQGNAPAFVYRAGVGQIAIKTNQGTPILSMEELSVAEIVAIAAALEDLPGSDQRLSRADVDRDGAWLGEEAARFAPPTPASPPPTSP
ncbi:MAG: adenylate/guanylate cyclase domain-containing protein [Fimbriimonadaceae bacterium]